MILPKAFMPKQKARLLAYDKLMGEDVKEKEENLEIFIPNGPRLGNEVIEANDVSKAFGDKLLYEHLNFRLPPAGIVGIIGLIIVAPYRLKRIISFVNPWSDPLGSGFQIIQSLYAIGPGGLLGQGFLNSRQKHFYLPEPQTDFIFSIISEEFGFLGVLIVSVLFIVIFYRCIKTALETENLFDKYLVFGLSFMLIFQTLLNLSVVVGLVPVTGVTLPFISYGGSSLLTSFMMIGIILGISNKNK